MTDMDWLKTESKNQMTAITDAAQTVEGYIYSLMDEIEERDIKIEKLEQMNESLHEEIKDLRDDLRNSEETK